MSGKIMNVTGNYLSEASHREMAAGVLEQAKRDLRRFRGATSKTGQDLYVDAYCWLMATDFSWPFSFLNVCRALNLAPESVRHELLGEASLGTLQYWARRCRRITSPFRRSLRQLFEAVPGNVSTEPVLQNATASNTAI